MSRNPNPSARPLVVLACGATKLSHSAPALELYTGPLFASARRWALSVTSRDRIFILSAMHGLVFADRVIDPYNRRLDRQGAGELAWLLRFQLSELPELLRASVYFVGGELYRTTLAAAGIQLVAVVDQLPPGRATRGLGAQRGWLGRHLGELPR